MRESREQAAAFFRAQIAPHAQEDVELGYRFTRSALEFGTRELEAQAEWLAELESQSSMTARPAVGNGGSSPPVSAAAIRPQSG